MKVGRNESCPCGSGKKYKLCCGAGPQTESPDLLAWRRLSRANQDHAAKLLEFIEDSYGPEAVIEAWDEFTLWSGEPFDPETPQRTLFFPWMFHLWSPDPYDTRVEARCLHSVPPTQAYLISRGGGMDPVLNRYLSACLDSAFGFFEVVRVDRGRGMELREILTETSYSVLERSASESLQPGDIVYAMAVACEGIYTLEAMSPVALPTRMKLDIVEERERLLAEDALAREQALAEFPENPLDADGAGGDLEPTEPGDADARAGSRAGDPGDEATDGETSGTLPLSVLTRYEDSIRELYLELVSPLLNPTLPQMQNTDGHALSMRRLIFDIESPAVAFAALKGLAVEATEAELLRDAEYLAGGELARVSFHWSKRGNAKNKGMEITLLGRIEIDGARLAVEVNSAERAEEFKRLMVERLGSKARYRVTEIQSMERLLEEARAKPASARKQSDLDQAALMARPEVQAHLRDMLARHYEQWVDDPLPALKGKTPREAVRTKAGREKVEALIREIERNGPKLGGFDPAITEAMRKALGI